MLTTFKDTEVISDVLSNSSESETGDLTNNQSADNYKSPELKIEKAPENNKLLGFIGAIESQLKRCLSLLKSAKFQKFLRQMKSEILISI